MIPHNKEFWSIFRKHLLEAQVSTQKGNFKEAITEYEELIRLFLIASDQELSHALDEVNMLKSSFFVQEKQIPPKAKDRPVVVITKKPHVEKKEIVVIKDEPEAVKEVDEIKKEELPEVVKEVDEIKKEELPEVVKEVVEVKKEELPEVVKEVDEIKKEELPEVVKEVDEIKKEELPEVVKEVAEVKKEELPEVVKEVDEIKKEELPEVVKEVAEVKKEELPEVIKEVAEVKKEEQPEVVKDIVEEVKKEEQPPIEADKPLAPIEVKQAVPVQEAVLPRVSEVKVAEGVIEVEDKEEVFVSIEEKAPHFTKTDQKTTLQDIIERVEKKNKDIKAKPRIEIKKEVKPVVSHVKQKEEQTIIVNRKKEVITPLVEIKKEEIVPEIKAEEKEITSLVEVKKEEPPVIEAKKEEIEPVDEVKKEEVNPIVEVKKEEEPPAIEAKKEEIEPEPIEDGILKFKKEPEKKDKKADSKKEEKKHEPPKEEKPEIKKEEKVEEKIEEPKIEEKVEEKAIEPKKEEVLIPQEPSTEPPKGEKKLELVLKPEEEAKPVKEIPILYTLEIKSIENPTDARFKEAESKFFTPPSVHDWRKLADGFAAEKDVFSMALAYEQVSWRDSKDNNAWLGQAIGFMSAGEANKAINALEALGLVDPSECGSEEQRKMFADYCYSNSYFTLGIKYYYKLPETAENLMLIGQGHFCNSHWPEAIRLFSHSLKLNENNAECWIWLGASYENTLEGEHAEESYNKAMEIDKNAYDAYLRLGDLMLRKGLYSSESLREEQDRTKHARDLFQHVLDKDDKNIEAMHKMINLMITQKEYKEALELANKGLELDPASDMLLYYKGIALYRLNHVEDAIGDLVNALNYNPNNSSAYYYLGILYRIYAIKANDPSYLEHSVTAFETALANNHDLAEAQMGLAETLIEIGDKDLALEALENARVLQPYFIRVLELQEQLLRKKGNIASADDLLHEIDDLRKTGKQYRSPFEF